MLMLQIFKKAWGSWWGSWENLDAVNPLAQTVCELQVVGKAKGTSPQTP